MIEQYENESKEIIKDKDSVKVPGYDTITDPSLLKPLERSKYKKAMKKNVKIQTDRKVSFGRKIFLMICFYFYGILC